MPRTEASVAYADVAVIGGGVVGLSIAYHAARRGLKVSLFEAGRLGDGASGAAAGMLNAQAESHGAGSFLELQLKGRDAHHALGAELYEETGLDPEYVWAGTLRVARSESFESRLAEAYRWQRELGLRAQWLETDRARDLEPALAQDIRTALYLPEEGQVNPQRLLRALALAATRRGTKLHEETQVISLRVERGRVIGLETAQGEVVAGRVVLAGGAQSPALLSKLGLDLPVHPVKGELLSVHSTPPPVRANIWDEGCYVVPKRDGRVIVGATERPGEWDRRPTLGGMAQLSEAARGLIPEISEAPMADLWGGLRPGTPSGLPILGPINGIEDLLLTTGHHRNGILLSAITGECVGALAFGEEPPVNLEPYSYEVQMEVSR